LSYWEGVAGWAILLATAATTAMWLEARSVARLMKWDLLRLGATLLLLLWPVGGVLEQGRLLAFVVYALLSLVFVGLIVHEPGERDPAPAG